MKTFVFILSEDRVLVIKAQSLESAMEEVKKDWYPNAFYDSFEVKMVTGMNF